MIIRVTKEPKERR